MPLFTYAFSKSFEMAKNLPYVLLRTILLHSLVKGQLTITKAALYLTLPKCQNGSKDCVSTMALFYLHF
jgi:hypothetical protein